MSPEIGKTQGKPKIAHNSEKKYEDLESTQQK